MGSERRIHFEVGVVSGPLGEVGVFAEFSGENFAVAFPKGFAAGERGVGEDEMMGAGFAGNGNAAGFGFAQKADAAGGAHVLAMDFGAGEFGQENVAGDNGFFADGRPAAQAESRAPVAFVHDAIGNERIILAVIENREIEHAGVFEGAAHEFVILDAFAVVGDGDDAGLFEGTDGGEFFASDALGDGAGDVNIDEAFARGFFANQRDGAGGVDRGRRIRHAQDRGESTARGGLRAGGDGFLGGLAGFAEVDVGIDQTGRDDEAGDIPRLGFVGGFEIRGGAEGVNFAIDD